MIHENRSPRARTVVLALLLGGLLAVPLGAAEAIDTPDVPTALPLCYVKFPLVNGLIGCVIWYVCTYIIGCD